MVREQAAAVPARAASPTPGSSCTRWSLARADQSDGRRNLWLRTLDRLGLGFDSTLRLLGSAKSSGPVQPGQGALDEQWHGVADAVVALAHGLPGEVARVDPLEDDGQRKSVKAR